MVLVNRKGALADNNQQGSLKDHRLDLSQCESELGLAAKIPHL